MLAKEIHRLQRKTRCFILTSLVMLCFYLVVVYLNYQHTIKLTAAIEPQEFMLDIPESMKGYLAVLKYDTDIKAVQANITLAQIWVSIIKFILLFLQIIMVLFLIFIVFKAIDANKTNAKSTPILIPLILFSTVTFNVLHSNFDDDNSSLFNTKKAEEQLNLNHILRMVTYYQKRNVPSEEIEYLTNQLYALKFPRYFEPKSIGITADKIPDRTAYLFVNAATKNTKPFNESEQAAIQEKALKFEKKTREMMKTRLIGFKIKEWIIFSVLIPLMFTTLTMVRTQRRTTKKARYISQLNNELTLTVK